MVELIPGNGGTAHPARARPGRATSSHVPHNLPVQLSSFVGRGSELAELRALIAGARLLTLLGPGGCGKTRLGLELAAEVMPAYPAGVVFTDLAPVADPDGVAGVLAHAVDLRDESAAARVDSLADHFAAGRALVVLDNCEHLVDACAALVDALLRRCPDLCVLATSREPLDVEGETGWRVPSLSLPSRTPSSPADLDGSEAVALFADRARRGRAGFAVDEDNAAAVAEICCRLEGLPLALELAAARVRVLGPRRIAAGLDEAFRLLTGGARATVARHRTLRASVDWSHDLLTVPEQALSAGWRPSPAPSTWPPPRPSGPASI